MRAKKAKKKVKKKQKKTAEKLNKEELALAWERKIRGLTRLSKRLTIRELAELRKAHMRVEGVQKAKLVFRRIAEKYKVSSGDLEQALAIRLGFKIQRKTKLKK